MAEQTSNMFADILAALQPKPQLQVFSVSDRGIQNRERVNLRVNSRTYLGDYFLHAGVYLPNGRVLPVPNMSMWLGDETIDGGSWVIIYTGPGEAKFTTQTKDTKELTMVFHWHLVQTIFHDKNIVPLLIKVDKFAIQFGLPGT